MSQFSHITCESLSDQQEQWTVVDIRDAQSFSHGHVPGAISLNNDNIGEFLSSHDKTKPVAVMCYHGISSQQAAEYLAAQGLESVASVDGGFEYWKQHFSFESE